MVCFRCLILNYCTKNYYRSTCRKDGGSPAAVAVIQTFGDYLSFNPHMHVLVSDGCFGNDGFFYAPSINIDTASLEKLFIHKIFKMLLKKGLISERIIDLILPSRSKGNLPVQIRKGFKGV